MACCVAVLYGIARWVQSWEVAAMTDAEQLEKLAYWLERRKWDGDPDEPAVDVRRIAEHLSAQEREYQNLHRMYELLSERHFRAGMELTATKGERSTLKSQLEAKEREIQRYRSTILKYGHAQYTHDRGMWCFWSDRHEDACTPETCIWLEIEALEGRADSRITRSGNIVEH
jgi:hypothetical protein